MSVPRRGRGRVAPAPVQWRIQVRPGRRQQINDAVSQAMESAAR
jgi:hypothetical protein